MQITIEEYNHYGTSRFYPKNELAINYAHLLNTTTLSMEALTFIEKLGVTINLETKGWNERKK
jgi:hypothetical protein